MRKAAVLLLLLIEMASCSSSRQVPSRSQTDEKTNLIVGAFPEVGPGNYIVGYEDELPENLIIPERINGLYISGICNNAFHGCKALKSVTVGPNIKVVGAGAFSYCPNLERAVFNGGQYEIWTNAFSDCPSLKEISLGEGLTALRGPIFTRCTSLKSVDLPSSLQEDGWSTKGWFPFSGVERITVSPNNPYLDSRNGCNAVIRKRDSALLSACLGTVIPDDVKILGSHAFTGLNLSELFIPASVAEIRLAFYEADIKTSLRVDPRNPVFDSRDDCNAIIKTKENELYIGFSCSRIPEGIVSLFNGSFYSSSITGINIPNSLTTFNPKAFQNCVDLVDFEIDPSHPTMRFDTNSKALTDKTGKKILYGSSATVLSDGFTEIGESSFANAALESVTIPSTVKRIDKDAFRMNQTVKEVQFGGGYEGSQLEEIGDGAFRSLRYVPKEWSFPRSLRRIGNEAFWASAFIEKVDLNEGLETIGDNAFAFYRGVTGGVMNLPKTLISIGTNAFAYATFDVVKVPESMEVINYKAFSSRRVLCQVASKPEGWDEEFCNMKINPIIVWGANPLYFDY